MASKEDRTIAVLFGSLGQFLSGLKNIYSKQKKEKHKPQAKKCISLMSENL